jgi:hypothetical protein
MIERVQTGRRQHAGLAPAAAVDLAQTQRARFWGRAAVGCLADGDAGVPRVFAYGSAFTGFKGMRGTRPGPRP